MSGQEIPQRPGYSNFMKWSDMILSQMNEEMKPTSSEEIDLKSLKKIVILCFSLLFPVLGSLFFLPAWSLKYWKC